MKKSYYSPEIRTFRVVSAFPLATSPIYSNSEETKVTIIDPNQPADSKSFTGSIYDDEEDTGSAW